MARIINSVNLRQVNNENVRAFAAQANSLKLKNANVKNTNINKVKQDEGATKLEISNKALELYKAEQNQAKNTNYTGIIDNGAKKESNYTEAIDNGTKKEFKSDLPPILPSNDTNYTDKPDNVDKQVDINEDKAEITDNNLPDYPTKNTDCKMADEHTTMQNDHSENPGDDNVADEHTTMQNEYSENPDNNWGKETDKNLVEQPNKSTVAEQKTEDTRYASIMKRTAFMRAARAYC